MVDGFNARTTQKVVEALDCTLDHNGTRTARFLYFTTISSSREMR